MTRLLASWRGRALILLMLAGVVGGPILAARATAAPPPAALRTAAVARGSLTQSVAVSGSVNAAASYRLSFKLSGATSGKLTEVLVAVGDQVKKDQPLARIDTADLKTALAAAQNSLDTAQARYDAIIAGAEPRDVAEAKRALDRVSTNYATAKNTYQLSILTLEQDLRALPDKLVALRDQLVKVQYRLSIIAQPIGMPQTPTPTEPPGFTPEPTTNTAKSDARSAVSSMNQAQAARDTAESTTNDTLASALGEYRAASANVQSGIAAFDAAIAGGAETTQANAFYQAAQVTYAATATKLGSAIDAVSASLSSVSSSVGSANNAIQTGGSRHEGNLDGARYEIAQAQAQILALQQLLSGDKTKITQAGSALTTVSDTVGGSYLSSVSTLQKVTATPKPTDVLSALSSLQSAKTALQSAQDNLAGATLRAPSDGTIATVLNQVGENVTATVMTLANTTSLTLRGTIGEADVAKLRVGQVATITVDAVGATATSRMTGKVSSIDPVATIQQGVPVYGVDVGVDIAATGVRPGMSGTANVIIASHQDVLTVPNLAVRAQGTRRYVQTLKNGVAVDTDVTFGISNDTVTEVVSGLRETDIVVLPQPRTTSAAPRPQQGPGGPPPGFVVR